MYLFFPLILRLSSNRREWNLAHPFQFLTPDKKAHPNTIKNTKFEYFHTRKTWISETTPLFATETRESSKPTPKDRNFKKMHSLTPVELPQIKESIYFSRTLYFSHHALTSKTIVTTVYIFRFKMLFSLPYRNALNNPTNYNQLTTSLGTTY